MAQTPLHYCRCGCGWLVISGKQNLGKEAGVLASGPGEWLLVREWESGGGSE